MNYLYDFSSSNDDIELPQLPNYDKTKYPYAVIKRCGGSAYGVPNEYYYQLTVSTAPTVVERSEIEGWSSFLYIYGQAFYSEYMLFPTKEMADAIGNDKPVNTWWKYLDNREVEDGTKKSMGDTSFNIWSNHDIYYTDNNEISCRGTSPISTIAFIKVSTLKNMAKIIMDKIGQNMVKMAVNSFIDRISIIDGVIHDYKQDNDGENWFPSVIDDSRLYRTPSVRYLLFIQGYQFSVETILHQVLGVKPKIYYHFVDKLPNVCSAAYYSSYQSVIHLLIIKDTGMVYTTNNMDFTTGKEGEWSFVKAVDVFNVLSQGSLGGTLVDGGYAPDDLSQCQPLHCYVQRIPEKVGIPNIDGNKKIYQYTEEHGWVELVPKTS